jgi:SAM-dependent methyltransferase
VLSVAVSDKGSGYSAAQNRMALLPNYYQWIHKIIGKYLKNRIADLGCGRGFMLKVINEQGGAELLLGIDGSLENIDNNVLWNWQSEKIILRHRNFESYSFDDLVDFKIDTAILLDVLEHIEHDKALLETIYKVLPERGRLIVKVPAVKSLYGSIDVASEHFRRYSRKELKDKAEGVGFKTLRLRYMNLFGVFPYFLKGKILKRSTTFSGTFAPKKLKRLNRLIPCLQFIDKILLCPVGLSLTGAFEK